MTGEHKSYGFEGGYNDWTSAKVFSNMRLNHEDSSDEADVPNEPEDVKDETSEDIVVDATSDAPDIDEIEEYNNTLDVKKE